MTWLAGMALATSLTFVEMNCENLFDCQHDSLKQDTEWVLGGARRWTYKRYWRKLNNIAQSILACGEHNQQWTLPDLVALVEVENDTVLRDLTQRSLLRNAGYEYVMTQSPDVRGIDVALLYSPFSFQMLHHYSIRPPTMPGHRPTRDILYAKGIVGQNDTLHIMVVHAPSRYGGANATRPYRKAIAACVLHAADSIRHHDNNANIVVTGDFNDYANDPALLMLKQGNLIHASANAQGMNGAKGTYRYEGLWNSLDHFFISLPMQGWIVECEIFDAPFLTEPDPVYGGRRPRRTYLGYRYKKGTSDHLPLVLRLNIPTKERDGG